jgi:uncharacterized repeat protein (TIGR03803 family)
MERSLRSRRRGRKRCSTPSPIRPTAASRSGLLYYDGALYGTTFVGGTSSDGTVFKVTLSGKETVLHSFTGGSDGSEPWGVLVAVKGTLYGTTTAYYPLGGTGSVFAMSTSGTQDLLCTFAPSDYDAVPAAPVLYFNGELYGTTQGGGRPEQGTVFTTPL